MIHWLWLILAAMIGSLITVIFLTAQAINNAKNDKVEVEE